MADKLNLLVADDRQTRLDGWMKDLDRVPNIRATFDEIIPLTGDCLADELDELSKRRASARPNGTPYTEQPCHFDSASLLVVDYDLTELTGHSTETGVGVAYLARCFSNCGFIVALNQFGDNPFDLSGLGDYAGFADVDLGGDQLANPGLWSAEEDWDELRPWAWPLLPAEIARLRRLTELVLDVGLEAPIFEVLGLSGRLITALAPEAAAPLGASPEKATFGTLLKEPSMGLRRDDSVSDPRRQARTAAARASQWLERWILAAQDRLIDAPHLAARYPSLIAAQDQVLRNVDHLSATGLHDDVLKKHRYAAHDWLSRPAWWATSIAGDERISEVADPWSAPASDTVFCEDVSRFVPRAEARPYRIEVPADSRVRYVRRLEGVSYRPVSSFART